MLIAGTPGDKLVPAESGRHHHAVDGLTGEDHPKSVNPEGLGFRVQLPTNLNPMLSEPGAVEVVVAVIEVTVVVTCKLGV